ncbi:alpha-glucan water dikinase, chloroplastic isoform X2 [Silene latifolia]|uniref:alpha-glucan water dikinase, chloroplastic isoform X2 n=1 Tax=Silene latifolia TaxID=37657 RepID=UPI003D76A599
MSNSIGHNVTLLSLKHQNSKVNLRSKQKNSSILFNKQFYGNSLKSFNNNNIISEKLMGSQRFCFVARAVLAADPASQQAERYNLDGGIELQVTVTPMQSGCKVEIQATNTNDDKLLLHWGGIRDRNNKWEIPSHRPAGTWVDNGALRTPFEKSGSSSSLKIEIDDPAMRGIEFLVYNEARNIWFKNNGNNFHVKLPGRNEKHQNITVPEDLVQVQSYLRWERRGKQMYTPEQEKEEYEAARAELLEEVSRGVSIEELRARLKKGDGPSESSARGSDAGEVKAQQGSKTGDKIPEDLVPIQAYIRWEKAGKPNFTPEEQQREFEEARKDLQTELDKGTSVDDIRKKIAKGEIKTKVAKQLKKKKYFTVDRIQRKKRDLTQVINKYAAEPGTKKVSTEVVPKALSEVELFAETKGAKDGGIIEKKKIFSFADKKLLVLVTKLSAKTKILVVTDFMEPLTLHWALSKKGSEWLAPPSNVLPPGSVSLEMAAQTQFGSVTSDDPLHQFQGQSVEIEIEGDDFVGIPFVLVSDGNWIKDNGSDFYVDFRPRPKQKDAGDGSGTAKSLLENIASLESEAQKSFMHRFNIAADLISEAVDAGELGLAGILVWMRFMATRQLIWNKNYNVKPREISKAQDRLTESLQNLYKSQPQYRELLRMIMSTVGRGGEGDVGQRIRDEILVIQRNNDCKGGFMEEWHQKLHNNTSPDDVIICQAVRDYIKSDFDISVYWKTLNDNGITKERLLSYDRAIHNEPSFRRDQKEGLLRDLGHYMRTLKAVHSGADLEAAISNCMGYNDEGQGFMVGVNIDPVPGLPSGFPELLQFILEHVEDKNVEPLLEGLLEARQELRPLLSKSEHRLKDLIFLDIAIDSSIRTAIERGYEELNKAGPEKIMYYITMVIENLALSSDDNEDLIYCLKGWNCALDMLRSKNDSWALYAKSVLDRTRLSLASKAESYQRILQPSAEYLGSLLGVEEWAVSIFTEELIRAGSAASLSSLINRLDPVLRETANLGSWQIISPVDAVGWVVVVDELLSVQNKTYSQPTILVAKHVKGEEEIPDGTVAVLTPDMPDVLSHVSVRARNGKVCFATCFDSDILSDLQAAEGKLLRLQATSSDILYTEVNESELKGANSGDTSDEPPPSLSLVKKKFSGNYAITSEEFTNDMVGAKSRNISYLKGRVPDWVGVPTSVALPFGVFEEVLTYGPNKGVQDKLKTLNEELEGGNYEVLEKIRSTVLELDAPPQLVQELETKMKSSGMPWPGDEGEKRWGQAWMAIKRVWASKWNERAYFSTRKIGVDHDCLCMAVLVQEIISADYAFVIHTTNPSSGDSSEIYAEVVKGLGETLVGAYPGRAWSFVTSKSDLDSPKVLGYPSKPIGLFIKRSIIFRSDSNGEDLEGYAGAGLYDSVPMDEEEKVVLDYSTDPLINDDKFRQTVLTGIARTGSAIEELYGSPQDIEGVVKDGKIYVVQTRPQM